MDRRRALIAVDVQADFLPGGSLAVAGGDGVVEPLRELARSARFDLVVASLDWHPTGHMSFASAGGQWPDHCVAGTPGSQLHPGIAEIADLTVTKGMWPDRDAYSAFDGTGLAAILQAAGVEDVYVGGLATDYCVRATVLGALAAGFRTHLVVDACAAVNVNVKDGERAVAEMVEAGAHSVLTHTVQALPGRAAAFEGTRLGVSL